MMNTHMREVVADEWQEAPPLSNEILTGTFWTFSSLDHGTIGKFLVLAPDGRIGNFFTPSVDFWQVVNGHLCLIDKTGLPSVVFNVAKIDDGAISAIAGRGVVDGAAAVYMLTRTDHPAHPIAATPANVKRRATFLKQRPAASRRPNLVVVRANSKSLHPRWLEGLTEATRSWDLCVSSYDAEAPDLSLPCDYLTHQPNQKKFKPIYDLFYEDSPLWSYERIWLADDDLLISGADINVMFHLSNKHSLDLSQPSLRVQQGCFINHPITAQQPNSVLRHEPFIEIMCPIFSQRALKICIGSIKDAISGYGLDHLWPSFLGRAINRMAIIDAVGVVHTRPVGATYNIQAAIAEQTETLETYGLPLPKINGVW
ncbi:hypothetical protein [Rhizobium tumorigenes]|uniref:hypothetical protein n=1 Tax=Rhizobium tumorigenes TaxID=2041385 RepID=UPI00241EF740|nr:hypothetical protein [Rhizobium tumorigenes]WFS02717.1 hypothetical protein PR016_08995 [Rhizobium tumorigenes]